MFNPFPVTRFYPKFVSRKTGVGANGCVAERGLDQRPALPFRLHKRLEELMQLLANIRLQRGHRATYSACSRAQLIA
jgi:hypothetical protein